MGCLCVILSGWGEAVRSWWPDLWRVCRRSQRRKVCPVLLCQCDLSAVLLRAVLGAHPLRAGPRVPQASRERRRRPASRDAFPLVLRLPTADCTALLSACRVWLVVHAKRIYHCGLLLCFYLLFLAVRRSQPRHVVVASFGTSLYSSLFAMWNIIRPSRFNFTTVWKFLFFSFFLFIVSVAWLVCVFDV